MDLGGKRILVTGGAKRVGAALVRRLAGEGARVIVHCHRSVDEARDLIASLPGCGHEIAIADFARPEAAATLWSQLSAPLDALINNASVYYRFESAAAESEGLARDCFQVNYFTAVALMKRFAAAGRGGAIVNMLDQEVLSPVPVGGAYSASRRALRDATLELAREFAPGIRVNGIAPGPVLPPVWAPESRMEKTLRGVPLARPVGLDDLIDATIFLLTNESVTGAVLPVDCGQHLTNR